MIDVDRFKSFNDARGHQAGDTYLRLASKRWRESLRPEDLIARFGGEEFIVLLRDTDLAGALGCLERLRAACPPPLTCSVGVAQWDEREKPDRLIGRADRALYPAKALGRDRVVTAPTLELVGDSVQMFKRAR